MRFIVLDDDNEEIASPDSLAEARQQLLKSEGSTADYFICDTEEDESCYTPGLLEGVYEPHRSVT